MNVFGIHFHLVVGSQSKTLSLSFQGTAEWCVQLHDKFILTHTKEHSGKMACGGAQIILKTQLFPGLSWESDKPIKKVISTNMQEQGGKNNNLQRKLRKQAGETHVLPFPSLGYLKRLSVPVFSYDTSQMSQGEQLCGSHLRLRGSTFGDYTKQWDV